MTVLCRKIAQLIFKNNCAKNLTQSLLGYMCECCGLSIYTF